MPPLSLMSHASPQTHESYLPSIQIWHCHVLTRAVPASTPAPELNCDDSGASSQVHVSAAGTAGGLAGLMHTLCYSLLMSNVVRAQCGAHAPHACATHESWWVMTHEVMSHAVMHDYSHESCRGTGLC